MLDTARQVIRHEAQAVASLADKIDASFLKAIDIIRECKGRVIITGMGKSGLIGRKIAATFNSTGTPSFFLHPAEGMHGDIGLVTRSDVVLALSKSGDTTELMPILKVFERLGVPLISITGNPSSTLAEKSDVVLDVSVDGEAGSNNLIPTSSTTAAMVMGDALAIVLLNLQNFSNDDLALLHTGGEIGRLLLKVMDLMHTGDEIPMVTENIPVYRAVLEITSKMLGFTTVVDPEGKLVGVFTDGDLRRTIEQGKDIKNTLIKEVFTPKPKTVHKEAIAEKAVHIMEFHRITSLVIVDNQGRPEGVIHLHDLLKANII